jgi:hypothetical protein
MQPPIETVFAGPISSSAAGSRRWIKLVARITPEPKNLYSSEHTSSANDESTHLANSKTAPGITLRSPLTRRVMIGNKVPRSEVTRMTKIAPIFRGISIHPRIETRPRTRRPTRSVGFTPHGSLSVSVGAEEGEDPVLDMVGSGQAGFASRCCARARASCNEYLNDVRAPKKRYGRRTGPHSHAPWYRTGHAHESRQSPCLQTVAWLLDGPESLDSRAFAKFVCLLGRRSSGLRQDRDKVVEHNEGYMNSSEH